MKRAVSIVIVLVVAALVCIWLAGAILVLRDALGWS